MIAQYKTESEDFIIKSTKYTQENKNSLDLNSHTYKNGLYYINNIEFKTFNEMFMYVMAYNRNQKIEEVKK